MQAAAFQRYVVFSHHWTAIWHCMLPRRPFLPLDLAEMLSQSDTSYRQPLVSVELLHHDTGPHRPSTHWVISIPPAIGRIPEEDSELEVIRERQGLTKIFKMSLLGTSPAHRVQRPLRATPNFGSIQEGHRRKRYTFLFPERRLSPTVRMCRRNDQSMHVSHGTPADPSRVQTSTSQASCAGFQTQPKPLLSV